MKFDVARASIITDRKEEYILRLEKEGKLREAVLPFLPENLVEIVSWTEACVSYLMAVKSGDSQLILANLFNLVGRCKSESQFAELSHQIPRDGNLLECYYLKRVIEICP